MKPRSSLECEWPKSSLKSKYLFNVELKSAILFGMKEPKRYQVATLGCRTNQYETQAFQDQLKAMGYVRAKEGETADLCIVNTCTVTESADSSSRHEVRRLSRQNPGAKVVVTGCYAERDPKAIEAIGEDVMVVPNAEKEDVIRKLFPDVENLPEFSIQRFDAHTRAFVKVQDGCNSYCTYCIIPYVRGRSRSRTVPEVVEEAKRLVAEGYKEIVLTGINIGDFDGGEKDVANLAELVRAVDAVEGLKRLRISSIDPDEVDDELADAVLNGKNTCPSMHIVLQSGSNLVLKRMNRKYTRQMFWETVEKLKAGNPDFTFTTDVIVGFPGEKEVDLEETLDVIRQVQFSKVHMFPYSRRPRTRAALYTDIVPGDEMKRRKQLVLRESEKAAFELRNGYVGREMEILTEGSDGPVSGHTANFLPVLLKESLESNQLVRVKLTENHPQGLVGEVIC